MTPDFACNSPRLDTPRAELGVRLIAGIAHRGHRSAVEGF